MVEVDKFMLKFRLVQDSQKQTRMPAGEKGILWAFPVQRFIYAVYHTSDILDL